MDKDTKSIVNGQRHEERRIKTKTYKECHKRILDPRAPLPVQMTRRDYLKFVFVRNPYTRVLSAYLDKEVMGDSRNGQENPKGRMEYNRVRTSEPTTPHLALPCDTVQYSSVQQSTYAMWHCIAL